MAVIGAGARPLALAASLGVGCGPGDASPADPSDPVALPSGSFGPVATPGGTVWAVVGKGRASEATATLSRAGSRAGSPGDRVPLAPYDGVDPDGAIALWTVPADATPDGYTLEIALARDERSSARLDVVAPTFRRVEREVGVEVVHRVDGWPAECAESLTGVGFSDVDLDGDPDLLVGNLMAPATLWIHEGDPDGDGLPALVEQTDGSGLDDLDRVVGLHFADFDDDGDPDLFAGRRGRDRVYRNRFVPDGVVEFVDETEALGLGGGQEQRTSGAAWGDYDGDGDLDLYVVSHAWCFPDRDPEVDHRLADHLYRNDGGSGFVEVSATLPDDNLEVSGRFGFAGVWVDYDRDHDQDLFVINDMVPSGGRSVLFANQGDPGGGVVFTNATPETNLAPIPDALGKPVNAMGVDLGDLNGDGFPDVAYSNIGPNFLMVSEAAGGAVRYEDVAGAAGVDRARLPWGALSVTWATHLLDVDNDSDLDLIFVGGELKEGPSPQPHAYFENQGDGTFVDRTWEAGLDSPGHGKASAVVDLDGDGFLELAVANWGGPLEIYRNQLGDRSDHGHWLIVDLEGDGRRVNRDALGAIVELTLQDGTVSTCFRNPRPSLGATGDLGCHFGLGAAPGIAGMVVDWPDGLRQPVAVPAVDARVHVVYPAP